MASRGRGPIVCPECREVKPDHALGCAFGHALREGRARDRRRNLPPETRALRGVVAGQVYQPFIPGPESFADLVDRITDAVSAHLAWTSAPVPDWKDAPAGTPCPGCGALRSGDRSGLFTLHDAYCPGPNVPAQPSDPAPDPMAQLNAPIRWCWWYTSADQSTHGPHLWIDDLNTWRCPGYPLPETAA